MQPAWCDGAGSGEVVLFNVSQRDFRRVRACVDGRGGCNKGQPNTTRHCVIHNVRREREHNEQDPRRARHRPALRVHRHSVEHVQRAGPQVRERRGARGAQQQVQRRAVAEGEQERRADGYCWVELV